MSRTRVLIIAVLVLALPVVGITAFAQNTEGAAVSSSETGMPAVDAKEVTTGEKEVSGENEPKAETSVGAVEESTVSDEPKDEPKGETKTVVNGDNLFSTVRQGGALMYFILLLGLIGLTIIFERLYYFIKNNSWSKSRLDVYLSGVAENSTARFKEQLDDELRDAFRLYLNKMERGMALLNGLGNVSPIIGFLGTVIGMITAFADIANATTVNAKVVAVGIQQALVTTAGGLMVAAPLLSVFHFFNHIIQNVTTYADEIISERTALLPSMLDEERVGRDN
ncbi:MAG: hypothetical protein GY754_23330 [bacterium]|nr:hypothetical protein [bacterium]